MVPRVGFEPTVLKASDLQSGARPLRRSRHDGCSGWYRSIVYRLSVDCTTFVLRNINSLLLNLSMEYHTLPLT